MKKSFIVSVFVLCFVPSLLGQNFEELSSYDFKTVESYKELETKVSLCADYLFSHPVTVEEEHRSIAKQYIYKWMEGTPDYTFSFGKKEMKLIKGNEELFPLLCVAMTKAVLDAKEKSLSTDEILERAAVILGDYCFVVSNNLEASKRLNKMTLKRKKKQ